MHCRNAGLFMGYAGHAGAGTVLLLRRTYFYEVFRAESCLSGKGHAFGKRSHHTSHHHVDNKFHISSVPNLWQKCRDQTVLSKTCGCLDHYEYVNTQAAFLHLSMQDACLAVTLLHDGFHDLSSGRLGMFRWRCPISEANSHQSHMIIFETELASPRKNFAFPITSNSGAE